MKIFRFIAVLFFCVSFTSASVASVQMMCCMTDDAPQESAMPCHEEAAPKDDSHADMPAGCDCVCSLQTTVFPSAEPAPRLALHAEFDGVAPLPPMEFHPPIDAPPRAFF